MTYYSRRRFMQVAAQSAVLASALPSMFAQQAGERPTPSKEVAVLNPRARVPLGLIIDDSTCLINLNRFAMPQFAEAWGHKNKVYDRPWREWPVEIPDQFVRKFGEWCAEQGVKGKYSIVPYPACVGRLDRMLPGWTQKELQDSINLVRTVMMPNWDIHPEMVSHTRIIDLKTGHPYLDTSTKFMENWDWTTGRSVDEIANYQSYALKILKDVGFRCDGITTPGGYGSGARPQLAQATFQSVRDVFNTEIPHYFRDLYDDGDKSVAPRVEYASGLNGPNPSCVVSIIGCTGDWTGGWDNTPPGGVDRYITEDLKSGRMVDVIQRGEPAYMVSHWTGFYWNGQELGFGIFREVVRRLHARFNNLIWMKLCDLARYWAAKELTQIVYSNDVITFQAPFACPEFTIQFDSPTRRAPRLRIENQIIELKEVAGMLKLVPGSWCRSDKSMVICFSLPKGISHLDIKI